MTAPLVLGKVGTGNDGVNVVVLPSVSASVTADPPAVVRWPDAMTDEMLADRIKALLEERAGPALGDDERIAAIDRELARFGHTPGPDKKERRR